MDHFNRAFTKNNNNNNSLTNNNNNSSHPSSGTGGHGLKDEREGCRSLICDANGIIIAEMVYRCMICSSVADSIADAKIHYHNNHIDNDIENGGSCSDPLMFPDEELSMDLSSEEEDHMSHSYAASAAPIINASTSGRMGGSGGRGAAGRQQQHHHHQNHSDSMGSMSLVSSYHQDEDFKPSVSGGGRKKIPRKAISSNEPIPSESLV